MISFNKFKLDNGLTVIVHEDPNTPMAVLNLLYKVGSRDESPDKTGFAHLFEHLMFGGSKNIKNFDEPLQRAGGENNAFTNPDITNYYNVVPAQNIETAFWLESDRMLSLSFDQKVLDVQKDVVCEEFKERYINQPYGMSWLKLRPLAYKTHPYQWATIGKELSHIENATMDDVKDFFYKFYRPNNAILVVAGGVKTNYIKSLAQKWFGPIPAGNYQYQALQPEQKQTSKRTLTYEDDVPFNAIYKAFHMCSRTHKDYHAVDMISDVLSLGESNRLTQSLVKDQRLFSNIDAYITGSQDNGLFMFEGQLLDGVSLEDAERAIDKEIAKIKNEIVTQEELEKIKNKIETHEHLGNTSILNKAMELAFFENIGNANLINEESSKYRAVSPQDIQRLANQILVEENASTLYYKAK